MGSVRPTLSPTMKNSGNVFVQELPLVWRCRVDARDVRGLGDEDAEHVQPLVAS